MSETNNNNNKKTEDASNWWYNDPKINMENAELEIHSLIIYESSELSKNLSLKSSQKFDGIR